jgi:hypothetical protein
LQRFASLGICAGLLAAAGRLPEALDRAEIAIGLAGAGNQAESEVGVFLAGLHGHTGVLSCLLAAQRGADAGIEVAGWSRARRERELGLALRRLQRFGRLYRAATASIERQTGDVEAYAGHPRRARRAYRRALRAARSMGQAHELVLARRALASECNTR